METARPRKPVNLNHHSDCIRLRSYSPNIKARQSPRTRHVKRNQNLTTHYQKLYSIFDFVKSLPTFERGFRLFNMRFHLAQNRQLD